MTFDTAARLAAYERLHGPPSEAALEAYRQVAARADDKTYADEVAQAMAWWRAALEGTEDHE